MKSISIKAAMLVLVMIAAVSLTGCIKDKKVLTLMPDGSGKMEFRIGFNAKLIEDTVGAMMPPGAESEDESDDADPTDLDVGDLRDKFEGFVAFTEPKVEDGSDGWKYVSFTGYFEDINKVSVFGEAEDEDSEEDANEGMDEGMGGGEEAPEPVDEPTREPTASFKFEKTEAGYSLEVTTVLQENNSDMGGEQEANPEMEKMVFGMMGAMMKEMEFAWVIGMPGQVISAEGFALDGRTATFKITGADFSSAEDMKKLTRQRNFKVTCGAAEISEEEQAAFKMELIEAKAKWDALMEQAEAGQDSEE